MQGSVSLRALLIIVFWGLLTLTVGFPSWYAGTRMHDALEDEARKRLIEQLQLVCSMMTQSEEFQNLEQLQRWFVDLAQPLEMRLTYVATNGQVLADSEIPFDQLKDLEDFSGRPEIAQAMHGEIGFMARFSKIMQRQHVFAAKRIEPRGNLPGGILRLAAPVDHLQSLLDGLRHVFLLILLLAFIVVPLLATLLIRRLKKSTHTIAQAINAVAERDYGQRIYFSTADELYPVAHALNSMAESTGRRFLALTAAKHQLEAVFNAMGEGVMVLDARGRILSINRALAALLDPHARPLGRRPLEVLISLELQQACERILGLKGEPPDAPQDQLTVVSGGRTFEVNIVRLQTQERETGAVLVFHDMSRLKQLEKVRQDFVANVSHELRTPLTSIKGYTETLLAESSPPPEMLASFLDVILKNTDHMAKMVDDLLKLARMEAHQEVFKPAPINLSEALITAWKACLPVAQEKQISLKNHMPQEGISVWGDFDQLIRVFRNLLENAIRYSPEGEAITVDCRTEGNTVTIGVANNGPSIPRHHRQRIFERFYRIEKDRGGESGGTGLGLAICRHIILYHGGLIWVESPNPGRSQGATFFFTLVSPENTGKTVNGSNGEATPYRSLLIHRMSK